jgi:polyisoprenoid-binding protein YceI
MTTVDTATTSSSRTTWQIDPTHSLLEFAVKHMMFTTVKGHFTGISGTILADEAHPERSSVDVTIDASTITTGTPDRDTHLRSADFLEVDKYPTITYRSTSVDAHSADKLTVHGDLTIKGTSRPVDLEVELTGRGMTPFGKEAAGFSATGSINRKDWGLNWNVALDTGGVLVSDNLKVVIEIEAIKA